MRTHIICRLVLLVLPAATLAAAAAPADGDAEALVRRVRAARHTRGFRVHASLQSAPADGGRSEVRHIVVQGRRAGGTNQVAYLCRWPRPYRGRAVVLRQAENGGFSGYRFALPDQVAPLDEEELSEPLFDTAYRLEDGLDDYWSWPASRLDGGTNLLNRACVPIALDRPGTTPAGRTSRVVAWVAEEPAMPLRIEKFDAAGRPLQRFDVTRITRTGDGAWGPIRIEIAGTNPVARTTWTNVRGERDIDPGPSAFTPEGLREILDPAPPTGE